MKIGSKWRCVAVAFASGLAASCATGPATEFGVSHIDSAQPGSTITIEVRQNERLAMFLFAYHASRAQSTMRLRSRVPLEEADLAALAQHREQFAPLADAFEPYLDKHPLFDRDMLFMIGSIAGADVAFPDPAMGAALDAFEPTYQAYFAPRHQAISNEFATILGRELDQHGDAMARAVAVAVQGEWRKDDPIRLDIVPYASRLGAFTNSHHTVMSARRQDYRDHALEMAFHEAAHTAPMTDAIKAAADAALAAHGIENQRFWHYLQFYAIGRAAQSVLGPDYVPYYRATGLGEADSSREYYEAIDAVWDEYASLEDRAMAAIALVAET